MIEPPSQHQIVILILEKAHRIYKARDLLRLAIASKYTYSFALLEYAKLVVEGKLLESPVFLNFRLNELTQWPAKPFEENFLLFKIVPRN